MNQREQAILSFLKEDEYITAQQLAELTGVSEKTVRTRIAVLNEELNHAGAMIVSKHRHGFILQIEDREAFEQLMNNDSAEHQESLPDTSESRQYYIEMLFLTRMTFIKTEEICDLLHISERSVSNDLRKVHALFARYDLAIETRPYRGMRLCGSEAMKRKCMIELQLSNDKKNENFRKTAEILTRVLTENGRSLPESELLVLISCLCTVHLRCLQGMYMEFSDQEIIRIRSHEEYAIAKRLVEVMNEEGIFIPSDRNEKEYITLFLLGNSPAVPQRNSVIGDEQKKLADTILLAVYNTYHIPLHQDAGVRLALYEHVITMMIRVRYGIPYINPLVSEIQQKYTFAYQMAQVAAIPIRDIMGVRISGDETAGLALIFQTGLESHRHHLHRSAILVTKPGQMARYWLRLKILEEFKDCVTIIATCSPEEFESFDMRGADCVFSTVPIERRIPQPIYMITENLDSPEDVEKLHRKLRLSYEDIFRDFFCEDLFFADIHADQRDDALKQLCEMSAQVRNVSADFTASVLKRENDGSSLYGNLIAVPHPHHKQEVSFVSVGILNQPVEWGHGEVQLIFLAVQGNAGSTDMTALYHMIDVFSQNKDRVRAVLEDRSFEKFRKIMTE